MATETDTARIIRQFQSEGDDIRQAKEPLVLRSTVLVLALLLSTCIALAGFSRLDRVVTSERGKLVSTQGLTVTQSLDAAIVRTLDAKEGEVVKKGQLLATLDPTFAAADVEQLRDQLANLDAQIARAQAEEAQQDFEIPANLSEILKKYYLLQRKLYEQRRSQYEAQLNSFDEKTKQLEATIRKLQSDGSHLAEREKISGEIEKMRQQLLEKQAGSYLNLLIASDSRLEMLRNLENGRNALVETRHQLASIAADRRAFVQQWFAAVSQERITALNTRSSTQAQLIKAERRQSLVRIEALEDSVIVTRARISVGSVLKEGDTLFTLMPLGTPLEAEVQIASRNIGFVRAGDPASIKVDAFRFIEHGQAEGRVSWISENAFSVDEDGKPVEPYYKARISIDKMNFVRVPDSFRLIPGMTLNADIHVGTRSVLAYLLSGAARGINESMREP